METLALKLAEILEISIESAIELYPVLKSLKSQFVSYNILNMIGTTMALSAIISGIPLFVVAIMLVLEISSSWTDEDNVKLYKKITKLSGIIFISTILIFSISEILKYILATDFMLIKTFLN